MQLAFVAAVAEVLVRFGLHSSTDQASQLAFAVFGNVAALGLAALALTILMGLLAGPISRAVPGMAGRLHADALIPAAIVAILLIQTGLLGLDAHLDIGWLLLPAAIGVGAVIALLKSRRVPAATGSPGGWPAVLVPTAWAVSLGLTIVGLSHAHTHLKSWLAPQDPNPTAPQPEKPSFLVVVMDTLRADKVGAIGGGTLTPNIDRFARTAAVYPNCLSTAPWTLPAHASLFTGMYPKELGVNWGRFLLDERYPTLAELLRDNGYECWAISNNQLLRRSNGFARGFHDFLELANDGWLRRCDMLFKCGGFRPIAWLAGLPAGYREDKGAAWTNWLVGRRLKHRSPGARPFLGFLNYYEVHDPYAPPRTFRRQLLTPQEQAAAARLDMQRESLVVHSFLPRERYSASEIALLEKLYDAEVSYQDHIIGDLLQRLREAGVDENTWVVLTSDHGELFGEQGMISHVAGNHYRLLHIPLIVRAPGRSSGTVEAPVQLTDVFATLLAAAGIEKPAHCDRAYVMPLEPDEPSSRRICVAQTYGAAIFGMSIAQRLEINVSLDHWLTWIESVYEDGHLLEEESSGIRRLFDVKADPDMQHDVASSRPDLARTLARRLDEWSSGRMSSEEEIAYGISQDTSLLGGPGRGNPDLRARRH